MEMGWGEDHKHHFSFRDIKNRLQQANIDRKEAEKEKIKPVSFLSICQTVVEKLGIIPEKEFTNYNIQEQYFLLCFAGHMFNTLANKRGVFEDNNFKLNSRLKNKLGKSVRPTSLTFPEIYTPNFPEESIEMERRKEITWEARNLAHTFIGKLKNEEKLQELINITETLVKGGKQTHLKQLGELVKIARKSIFDPERKIDPISKSINLLHPLQVV